MANLPQLSPHFVSDNVVTVMGSVPTLHGEQAAVRQARLFRNGANQAIRIPREFELPPGEVTITKVGNTLVLEPLRQLPERGTAAALAAALQSMKDWPVVSEPFPDANEGLLPLSEIDL